MGALSGKNLNKSVTNGVSSAVKNVTSNSDTADLLRYDEDANDAK